MAGLYIHIPFCKKACHYCNFHFSTNQKYKSDFLEALCKELDIRSIELNDNILESIYFGGGTPSLLSYEDITTILNVIYDNYKVDTKVEITLEANPDDLNLTKVKQLSLTKINRLSIGVQSFFEDDLKEMNRAHNSDEAKRSIEISINKCLTPLFLKYIAAASDKKGGLVFEYCRQSFSLVFGKVLITTASRFLLPIA